MRHSPSSSFIPCISFPLPLFWVFGSSLLPFVSLFLFRSHFSSPFLFINFSFHSPPSVLPLHLITSATFCLFFALYFPSFALSYYFPSILCFFSLSFRSYLFPSRLLFIPLFIVPLHNFFFLQSIASALFAFCSLHFFFYHLSFPFTSIILSA